MVNREAHILIVDRNDKPVGAASKEEAWSGGLIHRIVHVVAQDEQGRVLLQKRSPDMRLFPGRWTDSASGHVDEGEDWLQAGVRETAEEIGLEDVELEPLGKFFYDGEFEGKILKRFNKVFRTIVPADTNFTLQLDEVTEAKWFTLEEAKALPEADMTPSLKEILINYF